MILPIGSGWRAPTLADIDGDGDQEIVVGSIGPTALHVFDHDGTELPGWPYFGLGNAVLSPVIGDLESDGDLEIAYFGGNSVKVLASDGQPKAGWPLTGLDLSLGANEHLLLADLDGDTALEIVFTTDAGPGPSRVHAYTANGTPLSGWPVDLDMSPWYEPGFGAGFAITGLSAGDFDRNGTAEVVITYLVTENGFPDSSPIFVLESTGLHRPGWPQTTPGVNEFVADSPVFVDYDGDTFLELVTPGDGRVDVWEGDGTSSTIYPGLPITSKVSVVPGDLTSDGDVEIVYSYSDLIVLARDAPHLTFELLPIGRPILQTTVVDIDGDGNLEICTASREGSVVYLDLTRSDTGESVKGWPWTTSGIQVPFHAWGDLDGDGDVEVVAATGQTLAVLDVPAGTGPHGSTLVWPMRGSGPRRTYQYGEGVTLPAWFLRGDANGDGAFNIADPVTIIAETVMGQSPTYDCDASRDFSGDGTVDLTDAVSFLEHLFASGPLPDAPFPTCGSVTQASLSAGCSANVCPE